LHFGGADLHRHVGALLDHAATRGERGEAAAEDREVVADGLVDVAHRAVGHHACHAAHLRAERQQAAPAAGFDAAGLLDHDHVVGAGGFDGGAAEVFGRAGRRCAGAELDGDRAAGNAAGRRSVAADR
jgi:hypothetical protein